MWLSTPESSTGIYADSIGLEEAFVLQMGRVNLPRGGVELRRGLVALS